MTSRSPVNLARSRSRGQTHLDFHQDQYQSRMNCLQKRGGADRGRKAQCGLPSESSFHPPFVPMEGAVPTATASGAAVGDSQAHLFVFTADKVSRALPTYLLSVLQDSAYFEQSHCNRSARMIHVMLTLCSQAGMGGVDKDKVNRIILEMSKDSAHFKNAKRHDARLER